MIIKNDVFNEQDFARPDNRYKPAPFWFLNDYLDPAEMRRQVRGMAEKGLGGAFMHGRFGLRTPYFSSGWWKCIQAAVEEGRKLGFNLWIYDDMNWASGWAHGKVYEENPGFQEQHLALVEKEVTGPVRLGNRRNSIADIPDGTPESVYICKSDYSNMKDVTGDVWDWALATDIPEGPHKILYFVRRNSGLTHPINRPAHIDCLNANATRAFIRLSHEEYKKRFSKYFGKVIPGVFTDEPGFYHNLWNLNPATVFWTKDLPEFFRKRCGYDLKDHLISLWKNVGDFPQVRCDFYDTAAEMYCENYFKPIRAWCQKNHLEFTGHLEVEEGLQNHIQYCGGHLMKPLRMLDVPGIDKIDPTLPFRISTYQTRPFEIPPGIDKIERARQRRLTEKFVSSVAHLSGKKRVLSESYCSDWDLTLEEMKAVCDWQYVRGINFMNPHAFYYSIREERMFESQPSQGHNNIFWPYYKIFADYVSRLSYVLTRGKHRAPVALYYPIYSAWAKRNPDLDQNQSVNELSDFFDSVGDYLLENQIDFDLVDDGFIMQASIGSGKLKIAGETFSAVILVGASVLPEATIAQLGSFTEKGGTVIVIPPLPSLRVKGRFPHRKSGVFPALFQPVDFRGTVNQGRGRVVFVETASEAVSFLKKENYYDLSLKNANPNIKYLRRTGSGWNLYFLANESDRPVQTEITLRGNAKAYLLDVETGKVLKLKNTSYSGGWVSLPLSLSGFGSKLFFFSSRDLSSKEEYKEPALTPLTSLADGWSVFIQGKSIKLPSGLAGWDKLGYPFYSGAAKYAGSFSLSPLKKERVFIDLGDVREIAHLRVNGQDCGVRCWRPFLFEVTAAVGPGRNRVEVEVTNTQQNEFGKVVMPSGLLGPVKVLHTASR